jgi:hypothetical protein
MKVIGNLGKLEAVGRRQRQDDVVLGCGRLELEVELSAKALAQGQTPSSVDATAERGMNDQLHPASFIKEALQHDRFMGWQATEDGCAGGKIFHELFGRGRGDADILNEPAASSDSGGVGSEAGRSVRA